MNTPGFTAELSLTASKGRWIGAATGQKPTGQGIVPQEYPPTEPGDAGDPDDCEILGTTCLQGIRYLVIECEGVEFKTPIGTCPRPWAWWYARILKTGPWFSVQG